MRDIGRRIQRYRLSRYAPPEDPVRRRVPWFWLVAAAWMVWAGVISDHSLYRMWRLRQENHRAAAQLTRVEREIGRLDREIKDPAARREMGERALRETGGMAKPGEIVYKIRAARDTARRD